VKGAREIKGRFQLRFQDAVVPDRETIDGIVKILR
jgi:hypothetical protein